MEQGSAAPYDALLLLGDLIYDEGDPARVEDVVVAPFARVLETGAELVPVLGNHDYIGGRQEAILAELGRDHPWYVERVGPVKLVVLDSNVVEDEAQSEWLRGTLSSPEAPGTWTIVAMHHPATRWAPMARTSTCGRPGSTSSASTGSPSSSPVMITTTSVPSPKVA